MNKKKIIKLAICGTVLAVVGTMFAVNEEDILECGGKLFHKFFPMDNVIEAFSSNVIDIDIADKLHKIGDPSKCKDMVWLKHILDTETMCNLQKGELFSLLFGENSLSHKTIMEADGILSYGCSQVRLSTAHAIQDALTLKGIILPEPTDALLRNDHNYVVTLTGNYLKLLHEKFPNNPKMVWTSWNAGIEGLPRFASRMYDYPYTQNMLTNIAKFSKILN